MLRRVTLVDGDLEEPVLSVMTAGVVTLKTDATAHQAATAMARHGISHIVVTDEQGKLAGLVSQAQLFELKRPGVQELQREIARSPDIASLVHCAEDTQRLAKHLLAQGVGAEVLNQFVSTLNDLVTTRVIELTIDEIELPDAPGAGSPSAPRGGSSKRSPPIRTTASCSRRKSPAMLRCCAKPLSRSRAWSISVSMPAASRCARETSWRATHSGACRSMSGAITSAPGSTILNPKRFSMPRFFDLRPLYGAQALGEQLKKRLLKTTAANRPFLRMLTENALLQSPPLGVIRDFSYQSPKEFPKTLDLKNQGARLFVDAARVLALAHGIPDTNTAQRLQVAASSTRLGSEDVRAIVDAFFFIQSLRLRNQYAGAPPGAANRINPDKLNELDRLILKEAFKQARKLQQRLRLEYQL